MNTKNVGERSEAQVLAKFLIKNWIVLQPFGDNQRYDLVIDRGEGFERVQVKTARILKGVLTFKTCSTYAHRGRQNKSYKGQCDLFAVYSPDLNKIYLIKVDDVGSSDCSLRLEEPKNSQLKNIRYAKDFEL